MFEAPASAMQARKVACGVAASDHVWSCFCNLRQLPWLKSLNLCLYPLTSNALVLASPFPHLPSRGLRSVSGKKLVSWCSALCDLGRLRGFGRTNWLAGNPSSGRFRSIGSKSSGGILKSCHVARFRDSPVRVHGVGAPCQRPTHRPSHRSRILIRRRRGGGCGGDGGGGAQKRAGQEDGQGHTCGHGRGQGGLLEVKEVEANCMRNVCADGTCLHPCACNACC